MTLKRKALEEKAGGWPFPGISGHSPESVTIQKRNQWPFSPEYAPSAAMKRNLDSLIEDVKSNRIKMRGQELTISLCDLHRQMKRQPLTPIM
jgi:hypothetical protein